MLIAGVIVGGLGSILIALGKGTNSSGVSILGGIMSLVGGILLVIDVITLL